VTNDSRQEGPQRSRCRTETLETRLGGHGQDGEDEALLSFMDRFTDIDLICGPLQSFYFSVFCVFSPWSCYTSHTRTPALSLSPRLDDRAPWRHIHPIPQH